MARFKGKCKKTMPEDNSGSRRQWWKQKTMVGVEDNGRRRSRSRSRSMSEIKREKKKKS